MRDVVTGPTRCGSLRTDGRSQRSISRRPPWLTRERRPRPLGPTSPGVSTGSRPISQAGPVPEWLRLGRLPVRPRCGIGGGDGAADGVRSRIRRNPAAGRAPAGRPRDGGRDARGRSGPGLGRNSDRRARSPSVAGRCRRGPAPGSSGQRRRRRGPCPTSSWVYCASRRDS
jgi:hypothetical protein